MLGDNFGFRPFFIRLNNQIFYSVFNMSINFGNCSWKGECIYFRKTTSIVIMVITLSDRDSIDNTIEKLNVVNNFLENQQYRIDNIDSAK